MKALIVLAASFLPVLLKAQIPEVPGSPVEAFSLRYVDVAAGSGAAAAAGKEYTAHYTGWLRDGTKFDSSRDRNEPFQFVQGRRQVIAGWDSGFEGMKVGGKRRLFIPYQLAYGEAGTGAIPPKADLIFDVELLGVTDVPQTPAAVDVLLPLDDLEKKLVALAQAIPDEKYSWRPSPGVRSFGEVFLHVAADNHLILKLAASPPKDEVQKLVDAAMKADKEAATKAQIVQKLTESFAAIRKELEPMRAGVLGRDVDFFGMHTTRRGVYVILDVHIAEHMGQLIAYARMNGIVPPWSVSK